MQNRFSQRRGFAAVPSIAFTYEAPREFREKVLLVCRRHSISYRELYAQLDSILILPKLSDVTGAIFGVVSQEDLIKNITTDHFMKLEWYHVFDSIELSYTGLVEYANDFAADGRGDPQEYYESISQFERDINIIMQQCGIGWTMTEGEFSLRGEETLTQAQVEAQGLLLKRKYMNASQAMNESLRALSSMDEPNYHLVVNEAFAALESVLRELTGNSKAIGQDLLKQKGVDLGLHPAIVLGLSNWWGFASDTARHRSEAKHISFEEAKFSLHQVSSVINLLLSAQED